MSEFSIEALDAAARGVSGKTQPAEKSQPTDAQRKKLFGTNISDINPHLQAETVTPQPADDTFDWRNLDKQAYQIATGQIDQPAKKQGLVAQTLEAALKAKEMFKGAVAEPIATLATGGQAGVIGPLTGLVAAARSGKYGTQQGVEAARQQAENYAQQTIYQPQTETGKAVVGKIGEIGQKLAGAGPLPELYGFGPLAQAAGQQAKTGYQALKAELPTVRVETVPKATAGSVGAAAAPTESMVKAAITQASPELQQAISNIPVNKVNLPVLQRHVEADTLPVPIRLTEGQATNDPVIISNELNRRGQPGNEALVQRLKEQNAQLTENLTALREQAAPDAFGTKPIEHGQSLIDSYKEINNVLEKNIGAKYQALRDAAGGEFPVDAPQLLKNVETSLKKQLLTNDAKGLSQFKELQRLAEENAMTFEDFLSLRKNLGNVARTSQDGNVRTAASLMIDELEKLPLSKQAAELKPLADEARTAARNRFEMLRKDPAMKAAVDETVPADKFAQKFVVNGVNKNVQQMIANLGENSPAHQTMKATIIDHLRDKAGVVREGGNFSQAGYNKALTNLDNMNNLNVVMDGNTANQLKTLGNVAGYIQHQPKGSFVNNSNSTVAYLAEKAAGALETAGNVIGGGKVGLPIGTMVRGKAQEIKAAQAAKQSLKPGAGVELKNIGKEK